MGLAVDVDASAAARPASDNASIGGSRGLTFAQMVLAPFLLFHLATADPVRGPTPCAPIATDAAIGAIIVGIGVPVVVVGGLYGIIASGLVCRGDGCEGFGLALFSAPIPSIVVGVVAGSVVGALIGARSDGIAPSSE